eukprot:364208-Chlamydomonas_euryale.AAC.42
MHACAAVRDPAALPCLAAPAPSRRSGYRRRPALPPLTSSSMRPATREGAGHLRQRHRHRLLRR